MESGCNGSFRYSLLMVGNAPEGIKDLENIVEKREFVLAGPIALIHAHKRCKYQGFGVNKR